MKVIESAANPSIKTLKKILAGRSKDSFIIEGKRLLQEATESGLQIEEIFVTKTASINRDLRKLNHDKFRVIPETLMATLSTLETPPGILAVARRPKLTEEPVLQNGFAAFVLSVREPGNLGTIIRTAEATNCHFIACSPDCADAYSPKVVRGSMGSVFRVPVFRVNKSEDYLVAVRKKGILVCALVPRGGVNLLKVDLLQPSIIVIGGEAFGLPEKIPLDIRLSIPMSGRVESLNTGVAASIAFYRFMEIQK